ncbi:sigma-54-dependent transcriptional regulator [Deferrisoma camini]|uniref:sigma-54-dependent transcriptional regulator n=1 Tax=Deferrisoma camini TaxID=1035120 RepID=UPI00046D7866|nr:sigma-54 dependent transcriptional regulator [Deferrisoma camini]
MNPCCILVIESDGLTADHLRALAREDGFQVHHAANGSEGIGMLAALRPEAVFVDVNLPDMDGRKVLSEIRTHGFGSLVLMLLNRRDVNAVVECMKLGAFAVLEKPCDPDELDATLHRLRDRIRLEEEVQTLRSRVEEGSPYQLLFGHSRRMREVQAIVDQIADTDITVLIRGESGTGKDLLARAIYEGSARAKRAFVKVNCAALPRNLLESELFGYEEGAFTGAHRTKKGKFEYADQGTIFLDEITEMHVDLQAKLLHVLQDKEISRLGGKDPISVDVRIIAATNREIEEEVRQKRFRVDLFYRLNVVNIVLPPLRERAEEIPFLAEQLCRKFARQYGRPDAQIPRDLLKEMETYPWPGNVRELENYVKRIVIVGDVDGVRREMLYHRRVHERNAVDLQQEEIPDFSEFQGRTLRDVSREAARDAERRVLRRVLDHTRWNRKKAAQLLDISYKALLYKIRETGLE